MNCPFNANQRNQIESFHRFCNQAPSAFCAACMITLYPEDVKHSALVVDRWNCEDWNLNPVIDQEGVVVCKTCFSAKRPIKVVNYPGDIIDSTKELNYRERSMLSPIKLMTQMTRKSTLCTGRIGHYEVKGSIYTRQNYEFPEVAYGGTLGLPFERGSESSNVNLENVKRAYRDLQQTHPLLRKYNLRLNEVMEFHVRENNQHVRVNDNWRHHMLMPGEQVNPNVAEVPFNDLPMGTLAEESIKASYPALMSLVFPWLFPNGKGHYSMINTAIIREQMKDSQGRVITEDHGGYADATLNERFTLGEYAKRLLLHADRRFARDPGFLFFLMDAVEQQSIHSSNRQTARNKPGLRKRDVVDSSGKFIRDQVTTVPNSIRTSYGYKRSHYLDLKTMCEELGAPQLFMTFSCDDLSQEFKNACGSDQPWEDPVIFARHYNRKWHQFFSIYIMKRWAPIVGGITDWCYVMEIQDRGSPHMHMVLWTGKTANELIKDENVVCAKLPPVTSTMRQLVEKHQIHKCHVRYCKNNDPMAPCRFHYPKPLEEEAYIEDDHAHYARNVGDEQVNPYCPYLLAMFRSNMDIQVNTGRSALYYLAKYLTKAEKNIEFNLAPFHYTRDNNIPLNEHMRSRIVGSVEASYLLLGSQLHRASRSVVFVPTNLPHDDHRRLRSGIKLMRENSTDLFEDSLLEKYEKRRGAPSINLKQFVSFYCKETADKAKWKSKTNTMVRRIFYDGQLPEAIVSSKDTVFRLYAEKPRLWRTRFVSPSMDSESYYYQRIALNVPIFNTTFLKFKKNKMQSPPDVEPSWKDLFIYLVQHNQLDPNLPIPETMTNHLHSIYPDPGQSSTRQNGIYDAINERIEKWNDNCHWVFGSAGTGKSFLLKKFAHYYHSQNYCIVKLAPTGVAAYNVHGETLDRFMGMTNERKEINKLNLLHHIKLYKKTIFLVMNFP